MFDQYAEHGVHALDAKQLQVLHLVLLISYFFALYIPLIRCAHRCFRLVYPQSACSLETATRTSY
jgi:hypothetical protein